MSQDIAPWLAGLDQAWEAPVDAKVSCPPDDHSDSLRGRSSCSSMVQTSERHPFDHVRMSRAKPATTRWRDPLVALDDSQSNALQRRQNGTLKLSGTRSVSSFSSTSAKQDNTTRQRPKSASPTKTQETLEWRKRLMQGKLGYGDQTDLFGPSSLDNIFAQPSRPRSHKASVNAPLFWRQQQQQPDAGVRSSRSSWSSALLRHPQHDGQTPDNAVSEDGTGTKVSNSPCLHLSRSRSLSERSNQFDLDVTEITQDCGVTDKIVIDGNVSHVEKGSTGTKDGARRRVRASSTYSAAESSVSNPFRNQAVASHTDLEGFSPVYISKRHGSNGRINYALQDSQTIEGRQSEKAAHLNEEAGRFIPLTRNSWSSSEVEKQDLLVLKECSSLDNTVHAGTDLSLPEDLPAGTPSASTLDRCAEMGGIDGALSDLYQQRSPELFSDVNDDPDGLDAGLAQSRNPLRQRSSVGEQGQKQIWFDHTARTAQSLSPAKSHSSASPLKLFGPHDTFTNDRLLRRLSQLSLDTTISANGPYPADVRDSKSYAVDLPTSKLQKSSGHAESCSPTFHRKALSAPHGVAGENARRQGSELSAPESSKRVPPKRAPSTWESIRRLRCCSLESCDEITGNPARVVTSQPSTCRLLSLNDTNELVLDQLAVDREADRPAEGGKRPPPSPFKHHNSKRRRTLQASELHSEPTSNCFPLQDAPRVMQKDSINEGHLRVENFSSRPRNPTPSQSRGRISEGGIAEAPATAAGKQPQRLRDILNELDNSLHLNESRHTKADIRNVMTYAADCPLKAPSTSEKPLERKLSLTTQDFTAEAIKVMAALRARHEQPKHLASISELYSARPKKEPKSDDSASNTASSDVYLTRKLIDPKHTLQDPESRASNSQSTGGSRFASSVSGSENPLRSDEIRKSCCDEVSKAHVCKISVTAPSSDRLRDSDSLQCALSGYDAKIAPNSPITSSTTRTTCSTRKFENFGTLAPDDVGHLITEDCGAMSFDKDRGCWVKTRRGQAARDCFLEPPSQLSASDDDPLREISDLPVDEQLERGRISSASIPLETSTDPQEFSPTLNGKHKFDTGLDRGAPVIKSGADSSGEYFSHTDVESDKSKSDQHARSSALPSKQNFGLSEVQDSTGSRATSWRNKDLQETVRLDYEEYDKEELNEYTVSNNAHKQLPKGLGVSLIERSEVRLDQDVSVPSGARAPRSELFLAVKPARLAGAGNFSVSGKTLPIEKDFDSAPGSAPLAKKAADVPLSEPLRSPLLHRGVKDFSHISNMASRYEHEMHEASELSFIAPLPGDRLVSVSLSVSGPPRKRMQVRNTLAPQLSSPIKDSDATFFLSELPDFTVREDDEEHPSEKCLSLRLAQHANVQANDRYVISRENVVRAITDKHEAELYWEDIRDLDLQSRSLPLLTGLDDLCASIRSLNVSNNALMHLRGAPSTIRRLVARSNRLDSLTDWNHLPNLQYLDISGNKLDNLDAVGSLLHLRELFADDNHISSLGAVSALDSLLILRLRRNRISTLDCTALRLERLTYLDLSSNNIEQIRCLQSLNCLEVLKLDHNKAMRSLSVSQRMPNLRELSLNDCGLASLDVSTYPALRTLNVDNNRLVKIVGISGLTHLELLSMRSQHLPPNARIAIFDERLDARIVRLSHNRISSLCLRHSFLTIERLEMASVGLQELPLDIALKMANLRSLNLNFNFIRDSRPLLGLELLTDLDICGNKLNRLRKTAILLSKLPALQTLDLRDNVVTHGFYAPILSASGVVTLERYGSTDQLSGDEQEENIQQQALCLPNRCKDADRVHQERLDEDTRLKRRVYELLLASSCTSLRSLDGCCLERNDLQLKDHVWERLVKLGVVKKSAEELE